MGGFEIDINDVYDELQSAANMIKEENDIPLSYINLERDTFDFYGQLDNDGEINLVKVKCLLSNPLDFSQAYEFLQTSDSCNYAFEIGLDSHVVVFNIEKRDDHYLVHADTYKNATEINVEESIDAGKQFLNTLGFKHVVDDKNYFNLVKRKLEYDSLEPVFEKIETVALKNKNANVKLHSNETKGCLRTSLSSAKKLGQNYQLLEIEASNQDTSIVKENLNKAISMCQDVGYDFSSDDWTIPQAENNSFTFDPIYTSNSSEYSLFSDINNAYCESAKTLYRSPKYLNATNESVKMNALFENGNAMPDKIFLTGDTDHTLKYSEVQDLLETFATMDTVHLELNNRWTSLKFHITYDEEANVDILNTDAFSKGISDKNIVNASGDILEAVNADYSMRTCGVSGNNNQELDPVNKKDIFNSIHNIIGKYDNLSLKLSGGDQYNPGCTILFTKSENDDEIESTVTVDFSLSENNSEKEEGFLLAMQFLQSHGVDIIGDWELQASHTKGD